MMMKSSNSTLHTYLPSPDQDIRFRIVLELDGPCISLLRDVSTIASKLFFKFFPSIVR
uniref:Uncharacterized protein n=1 Tax=Lepeophtheirus salmonis TaxID=72036 RepID=A0A0K2SWI9_LEPSM